jgi:hypothetical protein
MHILDAFKSDPQRFDGVRPFNIWGLRLFYFLMLIFVVPDAWQALLTHQGPWDPLRAVAVCVWATYPALAVFGLIHPLRWLPLMFFTIGYKALWLGFVAWPLWRAGTLAGSPAAEIATAFMAVPLLAAVVPWGYAYRTFVQWPRSTVGRRMSTASG